jgi:hypothetical protein
MMNEYIGTVVLLGLGIVVTYYQSQWYEYVGTVVLLGLGILVTYYQAKWYEYDPDKDF